MSGKYQPQTVLVTGGCGFLGTNLVESLREMGHKVRILDNLSTSCREWQSGRLPLAASANLVVGDIRYGETVARAMQGADAIVHLAADTSVVGSLENPGESWDINANGTFNLLEACRRYGVARFIFASSNAVVGEQSLPIDETKVPRPVSLYGASKLAGEALCSAYHQSFGLETICLRFANCYGIHSEHKPSVVSKFVREVKERKPLVIYGDGNQTRDFVHAVDICQAIHLSLTISGSCGEVFQVASGVETTINELVEMIKEISGSDIQIVHQPERKGEIKRNYSDIGKARATLGFKPEIELREGVKELWSLWGGSS